MEVTTDRAPAYPRVLDEQLPAALHVVERYANNPIEADHSRLKARLRPMRGLQRLRSAQTVSAGHAFVQNLRRGHYEIATGEPVPRPSPPGLRAARAGRLNSSAPNTTRALIDQCNGARRAVARPVRVARLPDPRSRQ